MGTWGASLYEDDEASDLKAAVASVCKVPTDGDRLLSFLLEMVKVNESNEDPGSLFWLVVADQFERRGISCDLAFSKALSIIDSGLVEADARNLGADKEFIKKRQKVLKELGTRFRNPRPAKSPRSPAKNPPNLVFQVGEIYSFPMMKGQGLHPYWIDELYGKFVPDGWGALVVLATGRVLDWLPWCALASLDVETSRKPDLDSALRAKLIFHAQTDGAGRFIPKRAHARTLGVELIGNVALDPSRVTPLLSKWPVTRAIEYDWSIAYAARSREHGALATQTLASLLNMSV